MVVNYHGANLTKNIRKKNPREIREIAIHKRRIDGHVLVKDLSIPEIAEILDYAYRLKFEEAPDYDWILSMFDKMALRTSSAYQPNIFDWSANYDQYLELHKVKPEN